MKGSWRVLSVVVLLATTWAQTASAANLFESQAVAGVAPGKVV